MFMTTTLAHYQLPVFGVASTALNTEIGADQRSLLMRPVTPGAVQTELPPSVTIQSVEKVTPPMEFKQWLKALTDYTASANRATESTQPQPDS